MDIELTVTHMMSNKLRVLKYNKVRAYTNCFAIISVIRDMVRFITIKNYINNTGIEHFCILYNS